MTTIVKTASASDFLALVPRLVGFQPVNSIVFVAFRGNRTCGAMRFDLPEPDLDGAGVSSRVHRRIATTLVGTLSKLPDVDAVVPVVYTADRFASNPGIPRAAFVDAVVDRFRFSGFLVRDALCVATDGWGSYLDPDCPPTGRPLRTIESSRILDDVPEADRRPLGDIATWASLPEATADARARVAQALARFRARLDVGRSADASANDLSDAPVDELDEPTERVDPEGPFDATAEAIQAVLDDIPGMLEDIISREGETVDPLAAAFVIAIARSPAIRDVVMLQWAFDLDVGDRVLDDARRFSHGIAPGALETAGLMLGRGPRPDPERVDAAITMLKSITALAPFDTRAPLFCMLAWLNWALGRSSVAGLFVTEAQKVDSDYGLAELLRTMLDRAMLPEWAFVGRT